MEITVAATVGAPARRPEGRRPYPDLSVRPATVVVDPAGGSLLDPTGPSALVGGSRWTRRAAR